MECNGMGWDETGWNGMKWNGMKWIGREREREMET